MSNQINTEELKNIIAAQIKEMGLHGVLDRGVIETIKNKVMGIYNHEQAKNNIPEVIPEAVMPVGAGAPEVGSFPIGGTKELTGNTSMQDDSSIEAKMNNYDSTIQPGQNIAVGTTGNIPAYRTELPSFMDNIEPGKVIIFSQNELSESGENLTNKPLRTFENPDEKKSMNDMWMDKGQKKAEVYIAKLEKIGDLEFDYSNGSTKFIEKRFDPDFEAQAKYKENPYMPTGPATPGTLDINGQPNISAQISTSVDIEKVVTDIVMNALRNQVMTNQTRAINDVPAGLMPVAESFSVKMINLVDEYEKIDSPTALIEAIEQNKKECLIQENDEVQKWLIEGKAYYTPVVKMSTRKCYIKS